jgi:hypothetical protein
MERSAVMILAAMAIAQSAMAAPMRHWASFTDKNYQFVGLDSELEVFANGPIDDSRTRVRIVFTRHPRKLNIGPESDETYAVSSRADSRHCPQIRIRIAELRKAEAAQIATPIRNLPDANVVSTNAPLLGGRSSDRLVLDDTGFLSPIELWLGDTVDKLKDCWKPALEE